MNKEYLASLDAIRNHFQREGVVSLKEFFESTPPTTNMKVEYQPADYRYTSGEVELDSLTIDFLENITNKKFTALSAFEFTHKDFDLRKFFEQEGVFVVANISAEMHPDVGGEIFVMRNDEPLQLPQSNNTITLIKVTTDDESFVSYVNHYIENDKITYIMGMLI